MATQLFLRTDAPDTHLGTNNAKRDGTASGWSPYSLATSRGSGATIGLVATVTGPTNGVEITNSGFPAQWISPPVAADVTISGTITANIWASESNMSANVAINVIIDILRANTLTTADSNTIVNIVQSTRVTEVAVTTRAAENFTTGMTSGGYTGQTLNRGDRLRIRIVGDDVGTMAATYTFNASWNGNAAAADGDTYVTFTEDFSFESAPGTSQITTGAYNPGSDNTVGGTAGTSEFLAASFTAPGDTITEVRLTASKNGTPTDNFIVEIWDNSGGNPGSSVGTVATVAGASLTTTATQYTYSGLSIAVTPSATYYIVARRSGALNSSNVFEIGATADLISGVTKKYDSGAWSAVSLLEIAYVLSATTSSSITTLYLTDTASDVATASVDKEAWTSRGSGVVSKVTNTSAGWTAPVQMTDGAGGTVIDWFTKQLTAFTLTGMAVANIRALESNIAANASLRCEIARVNSDGTSPTVWASWCCAPTGTDNGELTTSEVARTIYLSGDDLAFTDGQRIRIRLHNEDISSAAMVTGHSVTRYYNGTSAAASGDTYISLPVTVTEYSAPAAGGPAPRRRRPAHRYTTVR